MRVTTTFRAPDEGEDVILLTCDDDGEVGHLGRLTRFDLAALVAPLRAAVEHADEPGSASFEAFDAQRGVLGMLEGLVRGGELPDLGPGLAEALATSTRAVTAALLASLGKEGLECLFIGGPLHGTVRAVDAAGPYEWQEVIQGPDRPAGAPVAYRTHYYVRWRPPVAGPTANERTARRRHRVAMLHTDVQRRSEIDQVAVYADALYRCAYGADDS